MRKLFLTLIAVLTITSFSMAQPQYFRGAWLSTVANIDWPSKDAIGNAKLQRHEMIQILDQLQSMNFNTVIFQIRPTADALYPSKLEPWSHWLTGKQGQDNDESYDPLAFVIEQAKMRNMDVHVWLNPYRVTLAGQKIEDVAENHLYRQRPEMFWKFNGQWYFEPGLDETREWLCNVIKDIILRYDVQGVHMDDYFYPYPKAGEEIPDSACFAKFPRGFDNIEDWRRNNVNMAIKDIADVIERYKPNVQFGISPFGIWRNKKNDPRGSETNGLENYDALYADVILWMQNGWIDYVVPQLYWEIGKKVADYEILAHWWAENCYSTRVYIGMSPSRMRDLSKMTPEQIKKAKLDPENPWNKGNEICKQLRLNRSIPKIQGECFFSLKRGLFTNTKGLCDSLKTTFYKDYVDAPGKFVE